MNIESFQLFAEVYRNHSFAEVAKQRNVAPSSVTRGVAILEDELGFRLFNRTTRKVTPTEEGEKLYFKVVDWLAEFESFRGDIAGLESAVSGTLRITSNVSFNHLFLVDLIPKFRELHPDVDLEIRVTDAMVDLVAERIDVAIRFGKLKDSDFVATKLFDQHYAVVASPEYIKANGKPRKLQELVDFDCISLLLSQFHSVWKFKKNGKVEQVKVKPKIKVTGALSLIEYAKKGCGFAMLPKKLVEAELKGGQLVEVFASYESTPTEFGSAAWLVYPSRDMLPARMRAFIDFMKENFGS